MVFIVFLSLPVFSHDRSGAIEQCEEELIKENFRCYDQDEKIKAFYKEQHKKQTVALVKSQSEQLANIEESIVKAKNEHDLESLKDMGSVALMSVWDAVFMLDNLIDQSDPDTSLPNSVHALQTAEAIRKDLPQIAQLLKTDIDAIDWFPLVGLLHDLGKIDALLRQVPQWAVVGDIFPVGMPFSRLNIFYNEFADNPDTKDERYNSGFGIYKEHIGLEQVLMSYGHDEYIARVLLRESILPKEAIFICRFHSFYALHQSGAYEELLNNHDQELLKWVKVFNPYDLYSKHKDAPNRAELEPYYRALINKYFPSSKDAPEKIIAWPRLKDLR